MSIVLVSRQYSVTQCWRWLLLSWSRSQSHVYYLGLKTVFSDLVLKVTDTLLVTVTVTCLLSWSQDSIQWLSVECDWYSLGHGHSHMSIVLVSRQYSVTQCWMWLILSWSRSHVYCLGLKTVFSDLVLNVTNTLLVTVTVTCLLSWSYVYRLLMDRSQFLMLVSFLVFCQFFPSHFSF